MSTSLKTLYAIEPTSERLVRWLRETCATLIRLYWEFFISLPITIFTMFFAAMGVVVGIMEIFKHPTRFWSDLPLIGVCTAFLIFRRARVFFWTLLGCVMIWIFLVASLLLPIFGADYHVATTTMKILLGAAYFFPPLVAAFYIDYARHRRC